MRGGEQPGVVQELKDFQRDGHSLDDLWQVAKGGTKYQDFVKDSIPRQQESQPAPAASVPEELVSCLLTVSCPTAMAFCKSGHWSRSAVLNSYYLQYRIIPSHV